MHIGKARVQPVLKRQMHGRRDIYYRDRLGVEHENAENDR